MAVAKFCVFCGNSPESQNKEHVLPQWLLKLTGDPNRLVTLGYDYRAKKEIYFRWKSLVTPACEACNTEYAALEGEIRPIVEALLERRSIAANNYVKLLDWLDKVRVGLWLNYHLIMKNPVGIDPSFFIKSRIRKKDRFLAVYPLTEKNKGLNAHGAETLSFQGAPSAFGLRVNNLFLVNCSSDYLFSGRCGFPFPATMEMHIDGECSGLLEMGEFKATKKIKSPLLRFPIFKPSVFLFQPIMQTATMGKAGEGEPLLGGDPREDFYLSENVLKGAGGGVGKLYRQYDGYVSRVDDENAVIEFDSITGAECKPAGHLVSQVYELQTYLQGLYRPLAENIETRARWNDRQKIMRKLNRCIAKSYINASAPKLSEGV